MALNIEIVDLCFSFGSDRKLLRDVSLTVAEAEMCCLLGPNGAGKTTLIRCLLGMLKVESGVLRVAEKDVAHLSRRQLARLVAYVPQSTLTVFPFTALDIAVMGRTPHMRITDTPSAADLHAALCMLERLGIDHLAHRSFAQLSGGERQLTMLARALVQEAVVLVLDEPTSALDYGNEIGILEVARELVAAGPSVLMTTHQPNHALMWGDRVVLMRDGSVIASGRPSDVMTAQSLSELYAVPIRLALIPPTRSGGREHLVCVPDVDSGPSEPERGSDVRSLTHERRLDNVRR